MRRLRLTPIALVLVGCLGTAAPAASASLRGRVPDVPSSTVARPHAVPRAFAANLPWEGGEVLHSNRTHLIFWAPAGSGLGYDPGYIGLTIRFLRDVASDSHKTSNVYGLTGQYRDSLGPATYDSTYAGAVATTDPLPANGCSEPPPPPAGTGPGWNVCLTDAQLQNEITRVVWGNHLPQSAHGAYFLLTPNGLGSCQGAGPPGCALGGGNDSGSYCGYHSSDSTGALLYAVIPYSALPGHCQSDNPRPNHNPADLTISYLSHEHNEVITDPLGNAWVDGSGSEDGDLCLESFGPALGGGGSTVFNQVIHGDRFYTQSEWSNWDFSCRAQAASDSALVRPLGRLTAGRTTKFTGSGHAGRGSIVSYDWTFGDRHTGRGRVVSHKFTRAGTYRLVLRVTDSAGNWAYATRTVKVVKPPRRRS